jgi:hypothetical protein
MFVFFILAKVALLKVIHPLKPSQYTEFYCPTLTGAIFASPSEV